MGLDAKTGQQEAPFQVQYKVSIPEGNGYRTQLDRISRALEHIKQFDPTVVLDASAGDPDNIILKVNPDKLFAVKGTLEMHYGFVVTV